MLSPSLHTSLPSLSASKPTRATPYPASACLCNKVEEVRAELLLLWLSPLGGEASGGRHSTRREAVSSTCSVCLSMEVSLVGNSSSSDLVTVDSKLPCDDALPAVRPRYVVYACCVMSLMPRPSLPKNAATVALSLPYSAQPCFSLFF